MSTQIRHLLDDANMDDEDIMQIMSIVKKLEKENDELKEENKIIEKIVRQEADAGVVDMCLPIWYGQHREDSEEGEEYRQQLKDFL